MLYQAHGIKIDENGDLDVPPKVDSVDKVDESALATLKKVDPPAILNVHRWSIEEDLTLLRAVPILGHMWAELSTRLIPHRDRGHLRKRYQVLERRVKATVTRAQKEQPRSHSSSHKVSPAAAASSSTSSSASILVGTVHNNPPTLLQRAPQFLKKRGRSDLYESIRTSPIKTPLRKQGYALPVSSPSHFDENGHYDDPDSSRMGFERILQENDWSHMSRVKQIMDNEPPNSNLSGVNHLASAAAAAAEMDRMDGDNNHSNQIGLAMLAENVKEETNHMASPRKTRRSILDAVMERAGTRHDDFAAPDTPSHRVRGTTPLSSPAPRIGYSPAFKGGVSPAHLKSPGMSGVSALWGSDSMQSAGDMDPAYTFDISDRSRQEFGISTPSKLGMPNMSGIGLTPTGHSNLMMGNSNSAFAGHEMDVIKALNELSNSPARFTKNEEKKNGDNDNMGGVKRSLFDKVVKGADRNKRNKKVKY